MGRLDVQEGISAFYKRIYGYDGSNADHATITLGATDAVGSVLRAVGRPGDKVVIIEPFHELYPNQCEIFYLEPTYVTTLKEVNEEWKYSPEEFRAALAEAKILLLNTPHKPTGKFFRLHELART